MRLRKRGQRILLTTVATVALLATLSVVGFWLQRSRDTDLREGSDLVTSTLRTARPDGAPHLEFRSVVLPGGEQLQHAPGPRTRFLPQDTGSGIAWGDVDRDGDPDLFTVGFPSLRQGAAPGAGGNHLFLNQDGTWVQVAEIAGVADVSGFGMGASFADYDQDGDLDLYVTRFGPNRLFQNDGTGMFQDVADTAGVATPGWSVGSTWGDFDRDGDLDLYVCNYLDYEVEPSSERGADDPAWAGIPYSLNPNAFDPVANALYQNQGDGTFLEVAAKFGVENSDGRSLAAAFFDMDGDTWLDLYVNNDVSPNKLFRNLGRGPSGAAESVSFEDLSAEAGVADPRGSMGLSIGDVTGAERSPDGIPDLFITHWVAQENALYRGVPLGNGQVEYRDMTRSARLGEISTDTVGWGSAIVDLDLDGRSDIVVVNGSTLERKDRSLELIEEPIFLLWNDGARFVDLASHSGDALQRPYGARGLAVADYDGDGDVDLAISINRGIPLLLENITEVPHSSLIVTLDAPDSQRFGARVEVEIAGAVQTWWYGTDTSFASMHDFERHVFGLGTASYADRVLVSWPNGQRTEKRRVPAGRLRLKP